MLQLENVSKSFGDLHVLRNITLTIEKGEVLALIGASGSGKTTLLRIIAGLEQSDSGRLMLNGRDLSRMPVHERGFGMVFQDYALFPHKSVGQNVAFGLRMHRWDAAQQAQRVEALLELVGLQGFAERPVYELSGGEQQRVALARALAPEPGVLLLDEPLGALDHALRERLLAELRTILRRAAAISERGGDAMAIYVTHDQGEAFAVADRVALLRNGRLEQVDTPVALYRWPRTSYVARFLGMENLLVGRLITADPLQFESELGRLQLSGDSVPQTREGPFELLVRPDAARLVADADGSVNVVQGVLDKMTFRGRYQEATVTLRTGHRLELEFDAGVELPAVGQKLSMSLDPAALVLVDASHDNNLR